jgi:hypothetical protein
VAEHGRTAGVAVSQNITVLHIAGRPMVGLFAGNRFVQTDVKCIYYYYFFLNDPDLKGIFVRKANA